MKTAITILAGGTGSRLWPLSTKNKPKQFRKILSDKTLIREAYERCLLWFEPKDIFISINIEFLEEAQLEIPELSKENFIVEPLKRDRTPAFGLIALTLQSKGYENAVIVACDEYFSDIDSLMKYLDLSLEINSKYPNNLLIFGANATIPTTRYGYIEIGEAFDRLNNDTIFKIKSFKAKPDRETAKKYIKDWRYLWNMGWFVFNLEFIIEVYKKIVPETYDLIKECYKLDPFSQEFKDIYGKCEPTTFDVEITEKLKDVLVLPVNVGWSDVGSWGAVSDILFENSKGNNVTRGKVFSHDMENCVIYSLDKNKTIAVLGMKDMVVIDVDGVTLITSIQESEHLKHLLDKLPEDLK